MGSLLFLCSDDKMLILFEALDFERLDFAPTEYASPMVLISISFVELTTRRLVFLYNAVESRPFEGVDNVDNTAISISSIESNGLI